MDLRAYDLVGESERLMAEGKFEKALSLLEICIEEQPDNLEFKNSAGFCLASSGQHGKALVLFEEAVRKSGANPHYLTNLACCLSHLNQYEQAFPIFEKALRCDSLNPLYMAHLAGCEARLGKRSAEGNLRTAFDLAKERGLGSDSFAMQVIRSVAKSCGLSLEKK